MARIIGNLRPEDDGLHPLGSAKNFNESMYFNFFDPQQRVGGFLRLGNRANEGYAEMTTTLYLADGRVLFMFKRPEIEHNDAFDAGGMRFEVLEPTERLRTVYEGSVLELAEPRMMENPAQAFKQNPRRRVKVDLEHRAVGPFYGHVGGDDRPAEEQFGSAHYEQHMAVTGSLDLGDGERLEISGFGLRDHSWGPRYWQAIQSYEWLTLNFGADFGAMASIVRRSADDVHSGGVVVRGDELERVSEVTIDADYEENGLYHRVVRAQMVTENGNRLDIEGKVHGFIPLRNRRQGMTTHIGEGMTEWHCEGRVGWGLSEFLRQVE